jgi:flavin reductase (DIM6/NTAB) family NADH-FMN oxidoreductase RutF
MEINPEDMHVKDRYGLLISVVQPRPIAWVSTLDIQGRPNLAPYSFFTGITAKPMTVCFAPVRNRLGVKKDTLINVEATKEFVVNLTTENNAEKMVQTSGEYPPGDSEFEKVGLTPVPCSVVKAPRVAESPVALECKLNQIVTISEGPLGGNLIIGEVVHIHVDDAVWKDGKLSHKDLKLVGRMEGTWYTRTQDDFEISRPKI